MIGGRMYIIGDFRNTSKTQKNRYNMIGEDSTFIFFSHKKHQKNRKQQTKTKKTLYKK